MSKEQEKNACDWLENLEGDAWADACEEIAGAVKRQAEGAQGEREAAIAKFSETCPMTAESATGGKSYDIELRRYYLLGWDDRAALAQPSPAPELDRPEVVAWVQSISGMNEFFRTEAEANAERAEYLSAFDLEPEDLEPKPEPLMTVAQHERIIGALRAESAKRGVRLSEMHEDIRVITEERDSAQARVAELEAHCVRLGQGGAERYWENRWREADARLAELETELKDHRALCDVALTHSARLAEPGKQEPVAAVSEETFSADGTSDIITRNLPIGTPLYAAPIALSAQPHLEQDDEPTPPEILACKLIDTWCGAYGRQIPWEKAVEITAITTSMSAEERDRLLAMADAPAHDLAERDLKTAEMMDRQCRNDVARALGLSPLGDGFAWSALLANIKNTVKAAQDQQEPRFSQWTYASLQATNCAGCGKHKHTPLRVDWMGGYVCLTCIDEQLEALHEIAEAEQVPQGYRLIRIEHFDAIKAHLNPKQVDAYRGRNIFDEDKVYANWEACRSALDEIKDVFQLVDWDAENDLPELLDAAPAQGGSTDE